MDGGNEGGKWMYVWRSKSIGYYHQHTLSKLYGNDLNHSTSWETNGWMDGREREWGGDGEKKREEEEERGVKEKTHEWMMRLMENMSQKRQEGKYIKNFFKKSLFSCVHITNKTAVEKTYCTSYFKLDCVQIVLKLWSYDMMRVCVFE